MFIRILVVLLSSLLAGQAAAQDKTTISDQRQQPALKIGVILGLTGPAGAWAKYSRIGLELAARRLNETGGVAGRRVELLIEDSQSNPTAGISAWRKLTAIDKVDAVVGDIWGFLTNPLIPLSKKTSKLLIAPSYHWNEDPRNQYFFTLGQKVSNTRSAVQTFFTLHPSAKKIAVICWDDPWGGAYLKIWKEVAQELGRSIVYESCTSDFSYDYRTDVAKVQASGAEALLFAHHTERIVRSMRELQFALPLLTTSNMVEVFNDGSLPANLAEGIFFTDWPPSESYIKAYQTAYGEYPILQSANSYDTLMALARAALANPADLLKGLRTVHFSGASGPIDFRTSFVVNEGQAELMQVREGKLVKALPIHE